MVKKEFSIRVPEPCHERWEDMQPVTGGAFCQACTKVVYDFTSFSDEELLNFFREKRNEHPCGRFLTSQLQRPYTFVETEKRDTPFFMKWVFITFMSVRLPFYGQEVSTVPKYKVQKEQSKEPQRLGSKPIQVLKGKVKDKWTGRGIAAKVLLYPDRESLNMSLEVQADSTGYYEIQLPDTGLQRFFKVVFQARNYGDRSIVVDKFRESPLLYVSLLPQPEVEITTITVVREDRHEGIAMGVNLLDRTYVTSGVSVQTIAVKSHISLWNRLRMTFRRVFLRRSS